MTTTTAPAVELAAVTAENAQEAGSLLAAVFGDGMTAGMVGGSFTCSEADNIASTLMLLGQEDAAATFIAGHGEGDDDPDDDEDHLHIAEPKTWDEQKARAVKYVRALVG